MGIEDIEFGMHLASWLQRNVYTLDVNLFSPYLAIKRHMYNLPALICRWTL